MIDRILIIGLGSIGRRHLRLARKLMPKADIRVLRRNAREPIPEFADGCFTNIQEAVAFAPKIAVVANPAPYHIKVAQILAIAGVNLLVEKPLSNKLNGISNLIQICDKQGIVLAVGYNLRFLTSLQRFKTLLDDGVIGKALSVRCEAGQYLPNWRINTDYRQGVSARFELGGGVLLELSHEFDYLRWLFGDVEWVKATLSQQSGLEIDVEDTAHLTLGFSTSKEGYQLIGSVNLDFIRHDVVRSCIVIGERGSLRWDGILEKVDLYSQTSAKWEELFRYDGGRDDSYIDEWKNILECVSGKTPPLITGEDGLSVIEIIEASRRSHESGGAMFKLSELNKENEL